MHQHHPNATVLQIHLTKSKVLNISGQRQSEIEQVSKDGFKRVERRSGSFSRRFQLPDHVDSQSIQAKLQDGVLTLTVPKTAVPELHDQEIPILQAAAEESTHAATTLQQEEGSTTTDVSLQSQPADESSAGKADHDHAQAEPSANAAATATP